MLAISLFWPYLLPFALSIERAATPHSNLALMFLGAGTFVFPFMLLFTAINYIALCGKSRSQTAIIPRPKRGLAGHAGTDGGQR
jgi:cytochrome d ubiquinol oxidase subunit II